MIKIPQDSPNLPELVSILKRYAGHAEVCDTCSHPKEMIQRTPCLIGATILKEIHDLKDVIYTAD